MVYIIKEPFDINVNTVIVPIHVNHADCTTNCMMSISVRSKPIRMVVKLGFSDWLEHLQNALLDESVPNTRNA